MFRPDDPSEPNRDDIKALEFFSAFIQPAAMNVASFTAV